MLLRFKTQYVLFCFIVGLYFSSMNIDLWANRIAYLASYLGVLVSSVELMFEES